MSDSEKQLVHQLAMSSLETQEFLRLQENRREKDKTEFYNAMNGVVRQHDKFQMTTMTRFQQVQANVDDVKSKVTDVASDVVSVKTKMDRMEQQQHAVLQQAANNDAKHRYFMSPLAAMFNTQTGFVAYMPVQHTNEYNTTYNVVVLSMPAIVWYNKIGRPHGQYTENETRSFFGSNAPIGLSPEIGYGDFCSILEKTPFKPHAVSKNENWNRLNFLMVTLDEWKRVEQENKELYPNRPRTLPLAHKKRGGFTHLGNNIAYTQGAPDDLSTGYIVNFEKSFTMDEKALVPAMGRTWTKEVLDTPIIRDLFGITEEQRSKYHIVGGKLEAATIKTHAEAYGENGSTIKAAMDRRLNRAKYRNKEQAGCHKKRKR